MKAMVQWQSEVCFLARSETGHQLLLDGPEEAGGQNKGPRPMELVLMGLGGCASYDVVSILKKARQKVLDCKVELSADRAEATPAVFTKIQLHFVVQGEGISEQHVARAVQLSA
ncbi:MAG TPA: osmotically inducible protein C, partial [Gammaproteobacteria bacterium]|nr:osmotically inducible protein C [Gammaproteobacteria bacterium]